MHGAVGGDDDACRHIADDAAQQNRHVDDRHDHRLPEAAVPPAEVRPDVLGFVQWTGRRVGTVGRRRTPSHGVRRRVSTLQ